MNTIWSVAFWKGLGERAIKTFAAALGGLIGTGALGLLDVNWKSVLSAALLSTLVTVLIAIANPSFVAGKDNEPKSDPTSDHQDELQVEPEVREPEGVPENEAVNEPTDPAEVDLNELPEPIEHDDLPEPPDFDDGTGPKQQ